MDNKVNETEIPAKYRKLIVFYEKKIEIDPDTAIIKTQKKFNLEKTQVRKIIAKYSKYTTPSAYKKMVRDSEAMGSLVADDAIDKELNEKYSGLIDSKDLEVGVKSLELQGYDVKGMFTKFVQIVTHDDIKELTGDTIISLKKDIPLRKTLSQRVKERKGQAELMEAEKRIRIAETDIVGEGIAQHIVKAGAQRAMGDEQSNNASFNDDEIENIKYNEEYEEMYNEMMNLVLEASVSNNKAVLDFKKRQFKLKWAYRNKKAGELRQLRAERERRRAEMEVSEDQELEEFLNGLSTTELKELYNEQCGDV